MNASNASEASCEFTPASPTVDLYKNDERESAESELFRVLATIIVFVSWVYLIVKAYLDYEANRAEFLDIELRNEVEGDNGLHDMFNNANDLDPGHGNDPAVIGPVQLQPTAGAPHASASAEAPSAAAAAARQTSPERRRRQRSSDVTSAAASSDLDDAASSVASSDDARSAESGLTDVAAEKPKNNPLRHVRKYARVLNPEDSRSREPETSDEDHVPSNDRFKPEAANAHAPTDERDDKPITTTVAIATQTETLSLVDAVEDCDAGTQTTPDFPALQLEQRRADCQVIRSEAEQPLLANDPKPAAPEVHKEPSDGSPVIPLIFQQPLEKDPPPTPLRSSQLERQQGPTRIAALNRHGTIFDEDLIAEATAHTKWNALGASVKRSDNSNTMPTHPSSCSSSSSPSHRIIDSLNASLLEQLAIDLALRMATQEICDETLLRQELESQTRARRESQRTYADVVQQVKWFGLGWESARREAEKENEESERSGQTILDSSSSDQDDARQGRAAADAPSDAPSGAPSDEQIIRDPDWWRLKKQN